MKEFAAAAAKKKIVGKIHVLLIHNEWCFVLGENEISSEPQHLCHILTTGVFPTMSVTDARCYGSAIGISKKQLWSLFSLDK